MSVQSLWAAMDWGDLWQDADLASCIQYARAAKCLQLSPQWREVMPDFLG